jgi:hypothetical protein
MMSKLSELGRWLWMEAQLGAPAFVERAVMPRLHEAKEIARLLARPYLTLHQWRGQNEEGALTVNYAGLGYAEPLLKSLLFEEDPSEREISQVPVWRPEGLASALGSDVTIIESSNHLIRKLSSQNAITLPFRVQFVLDIQGEWKEVEQRFRRDARRNDMRKAEKFGYEYEISHRETDLEMFYRDMYLPTMQKRHGELAALLPRREAYQLLRHGCLFLSKRDGMYVAGGLCYVRQGILEFKEMGVLNGDEQLMREGAVGAMNYLRIRWAHQEGYKGVNFGECWPYLSGIFQSKRKWGAVVSIPSHEHKQIWIGIHRNTPAVSQFLKCNPCIILDGKGELQGLIVTDATDNVPSQTEAAWHKLYATPGLGGLLVRSVADLMQKPKF